LRGPKINIKIKERKEEKKHTSDSRRVASRARAGTLLLLPLLQLLWLLLMLLSLLW
jgi:hypothetical protein